MKAECECKLDNLINNNTLANNAFYKNQVGDIEEILNHINIEILKCSNKIFKNRKISSYKGSFIILVFIFIQVILTLFYCIVDITSLKKYIINILNSFLNHFHKDNNDPPKKKKGVKFAQSENGDEKKHQHHAKHKKLNTETPSVKSHNINRNKNHSLNRSHSSKKKLRDDKKFITEDVPIVSSTKKNLSDTKINSIMVDESNKSSNGYNFDIDQYLETDYDNMPFEEIKERDHRLFCGYLVDQIKSNFILVSAIVNNDPFKPRTIKLLLFILNVDFYFVVNALFINEDFISEVYHSDKNSFFDIIARSIDRIFYTALVKVVLNYILDFFFIDENRIKVILKRKKIMTEEVKSEINNIIKQIQRRFIFFILFSFIVSIFSLFYITCFNYKYYYITNEWIYSSIFIIVFMEILSLAIIILGSLLRFLSLKVNSEKIYKMSQVLS